MFVTIEKLREMNACAPGKDWFTKEFAEGVEHGELCECLLTENFDWANWFLSRALSREGKIRYAIFAAEQVLDIFEKKYPEDDHPRKAIQAAKDILDRKIDRAAANAAHAAARAAANAAHAAARAAAFAAADAAAYAAADAADAAAYAAAYAADAADAAAYAAADAAADAADEMKTRIIRHGIELLNTQAER